MDLNLINRFRTIELDWIGLDFNRIVVYFNTTTKPGKYEILKTKQLSDILKLIEILVSGISSIIAS